MRSFPFYFVALLAPLGALAAPPRLTLQVAKFRDLSKPETVGEVEVTAIVPTQQLLYKKRAPKQFQAAAVVELSVVKPDGQTAWQETVTLRPPTISDTTAAIKNPVSFVKRVRLPDGAYTLRGRVRDQNNPASGETTLEQPLKVAATTGPAFSDVLLLSEAARKATGGDTYFNRGGYQLTRAVGNFYGRGADNVFFYTELSQLPAARPVVLHYHLQNPEGYAADADADPIAPATGRPTAIVGQLPLGPLPTGPFTLTIEARDAATKKLLAKVSQAGQRNTTDYAPAGAALPK